MLIAQYGQRRPLGLLKVIRQEVIIYQAKYVPITYPAKRCCATGCGDKIKGTSKDDQMIEVLNFNGEESAYLEIGCVDWFENGHPDYGFPHGKLKMTKKKLCEAILGRDPDSRQPHLFKCQNEAVTVLNVESVSRFPMNLCQDCYDRILKNIEKKEMIMYKNNSIMDCGYFFGGDSRGLLYIPPEGSNDTPGIIPWSELLPEDEDVQDDNDKK